MQVTANDSLPLLDYLRDGLMAQVRWSAFPRDLTLLSPADVLLFTRHAAMEQYFDQLSLDKGSFYQLPLADVFQHTYEQLLEKDPGSQSAYRQPAAISLDMVTLEKSVQTGITRELNIEQLMHAIGQLGFPPSLELDMRLEMSNKPDHFKLFHQDAVTADHFSYFLLFDKEGNNAYAFKGYDAVYRNELTAGKGMLNGVDIEQLHKDMTTIDWRHHFADIELNRIIMPKRDKERAVLIEDILQRLNLLHQHPKGTNVADLLSFMHWDNTPNQDLINDLDWYRKQFTQTLRVNYPGAIQTTTANQFLQEKSNFMSKDNVQYLQEDMKYLGFSETLGLGKQLADKIAEGAKEFTLKAQPQFKNEKGGQTPPMDVELFFRQSDKTQLYYFNKYNLTAKNEFSGRDVSNTFYIDKGQGYTLKEAYNLMQGRAVNKEVTNQKGETAKAWVQLNFAEKDKHDNYKMQMFFPKYGFDLEKAVSKLPIAELNNADQRERLLKSLQKGNVEAVTVEGAKGPERVYIAANPEFKKINVNKEPVLAQEQSKGEKQGAGKSKIATEDDDGSKKKRGKKDDASETEEVPRQTNGKKR